MSNEVNYVQSDVEYNVFFSYQYKDAREVEQILEALHPLGLNVWIDKREGW
jgi:hypothetical protein